MPSTSNIKKPRSFRTRGISDHRIFRFLGSMELAVTLFITLAVASIIGTVLQQNQPYTDYLIKFGPFWFEVFEAAGLYDIYGSLWFLAILTILVISTSVCVIRHTPSMLRNMFQLRSHLQEKSLRGMRHNAGWTVSTPKDQAVTTLMAELSKQGFRVKQTEKYDATLISAMRGGLNRLGYILTHSAIIMICVGGLLDSKLPIKWAEWNGELKVETRDIPITQVPNKSRLTVGKQAFRGSIHIPEERSSAVSFVAIRDGYLVQSLPFRIEVKAFRTEHYNTGQPQSFETDLIIHDIDLSEPLVTTISVNHPLHYKGYTIYQAGFSDGGSELSIDIWPLGYRGSKGVVSIEAKVFQNLPFSWGEEKYQLEITEFRLFNINADPTEGDPSRLRDFGPSIGFKMRSVTGETLEYLNYMLPVERNEREFYLSGVRSSPTEEFGYLYLPVDKDGGLAGFNRFLNQVRNVDLVTSIAGEMTMETLASINIREDSLQQSLQQALTMLVAMFEQGGFSMVSKFIETSLPKADSKILGSTYLAMLRDMLARIYFSVIDNKSEIVDEAQLLFLQDAVDSIGSLPRYGSPVLLLLSDYKHIEASGLQVVRSPGKPIVYSGCAFLVVGILLLFYLPQRRIWSIIKTRQQGVGILVAGMGNRNHRNFNQFFEQVVYDLKRLDKNLP